MHTYHRALGLADVNAAARIGVTSFEELPVALQHVSFDKVVSFFGETWVDWLHSTGDVLPTTVIGVVTLSCTYLQEVKPGPAEGRLRVARTGTSSFDLAMELRQHGRAVATCTAVLVHKDFQAVRAVPLTPEQRDLLARV